MTSKTAKGRILIGEDTGPNRMGEWLQAQGYEVEVAADGEQCVRQARLSEPDLVLLDLSSPKESSFKFLKTLHSELANAKTGVLLCVPRELEIDSTTVGEIGRFDLLLKPFESRELIDKVTAFFARRNRVTLLAAIPETASAVVEDFKPRLESGRGRFSLWGTRGSTPTPGARFLRHGGNTSCLSVTYGEEKLIFDAGSGIRDLGMVLMTEPPRKLRIFVTHTYWDHIQGFPFFAPAYSPGFDIEIYGAEKFGKNLESVFRGQLDQEYFPVQMEDMNSNIRFVDLAPSPMVIGDTKIFWEFAQHPGVTVGYKIALGGYQIAWVPDNEFLEGYTGAPEAITVDHPLVEPYLRMIEFLKGVDVLIHEAQYTNDEYPNKVGWGHSSISNACLLAKFAGIKRWIITHHDPIHDDVFLENKLNLTRQILARIDHACQVSHGYDGQIEHF